jgi:hypothetical protein
MEGIHGRVLQRGSKHFCGVPEKTYTQEPLVMGSEVQKALWEVTGNKAVGIDELPIELIKAAGKAAITTLTALCQQIWKSNLWPQELRRSIFLPLPKKKMPLDCVPFTEPLR